MKSRSETATSEQVLQAFYEHPKTGVLMHEAYKLMPGYIIPAGMLEALYEAGALIVANPFGVETHPPDDDYIDPWNFYYRLSYEKWVELASRNKGK